MKLATRILCVTLFLLIGYTSAFSQLERQNPTISSIVKDTILWQNPFQVSEIPIRSQQTNDFLEKVLEGITTREIEDIFADEWDSVSLEIIKADESFIIDSTTILGASAIQNRLTEWTIFHKKIDDWNNELTDDISWTAEQRELIANLRVLWDNTRKFAITKNAVQGVIDQINSVRKSVREADAEIKKNLDALLARQVETTDLLARIDHKIQQLEKEREFALRSYLVPDRPALWTELANLSENTEELGTQLKELISVRGKEFERYFKNNRYNFLVSLFILGIITFALIVLKQRSSTWFQNFEEGTDYENATIKIINRPFPVALILTILITAYFILETVPLYFVDALWFVALFPLLAILFPVTPKETRKYIIIISVIAIINRSDNLIYELPIMARLIILTNSILITSVLIWLSIKGVHRQITRPILFNLINLIRIFGLISMPVAIVSNIFGNTTLAEFLVNGYVDSLLAVLLIFILLLVFRSLNDVIMLSPFLRKLNVVKNHANKIEISLNKIAFWGLMILLLRNIANAYQVRDEIGKGISAFFLTPVEVGSISITAADIILFFFVIWLSLRISRIVSSLLEEDILVRAKATKGITATIVTMTKLVIVVVGFVIAVAASGFELSSLTLLVSAFGVGIGFGLQNIFNNFVSGIIIATERPVEVGDAIQVGGLTGSVKSVGIRSSVVRTWDGSEVIVPNGNLISNDLINYTHSDSQIRMTVPFGIAYGSNPHQAIELARNVANENEGVLKYPSPYVLFIGFGDSSLDFELRFWTNDYDNWIFIKSDVVLGLHDGLYEAGIEIPFPQRDLHLRSVDDSIEGVIKSVEEEKEISTQKLKQLEEQYKKDQKTDKKTSSETKKVESKPNGAKEKETPVQDIDTGKTADSSDDSDSDSDSEAESS